MKRLFMLVALVLWCGAAGQAYAYGDCASGDYVRSFDARITARACEELARFQIRIGGRSVDMRVIRPTGTAHSSDALWIRHVETLASRLGPAMEAMGQLNLAPVSVMLSNLTREHGEVHAAAEGRDATGARIGEECKITFYKLGGTVPVEEFTFTYAHEIFHCIQHKTWLQRTNLNNATWWVEGTAEYFAHLVQQGSAYGDWAFSEFDQQSNSRSLIDMTYGNAVFFAWWSQTRGPVGVRAFILAMTAEPGREAQFSALQSAVASEAWLQFGEAYADGRVTQPGGRRVARPRQVAEAFTIRASGRRALSTGERYVLTRRTVTFESGRSYGLRVNVATNGVRTRMSPGADGAWDDPPPRVNACQSNKTFRIITTSVERAGQNELEIDASPRMSEGACCLVGKWSPTAPTLGAMAALKNQVGAMMAVGGVRPVCRYTAGTWVLGFQADGNGRVQWKDFSNECKTTLPKGDMITLQRQNGDLDFTWRMEGEQAFVSYTGTTMAGHIKMSMGGRQMMQRSIPIDLPVFRTHGIGQVCRGNELQTKGLYSLPAVSDHTRIGEP